MIDVRALKVWLVAGLTLVVLLFGMSVFAACQMAYAQGVAASQPVAAASQVATQAAPASADDAQWFVDLLRDGVRGSNWRLALAAGLALLVLALRKSAGRIWGALSESMRAAWLGRLLAWFQTDRGGALLAVAAGALAAMCRAWSAGASIDGAVLLQAVFDAAGVALITAGAYVIPKKLAAPSDKR
jgi:hypothetical protein